MPLKSYKALNPGLANRIVGVVGTKEMGEQLTYSWDSWIDVKITAAQMDTLNATPVSLIPAPGAGLVTLVQGVFTRVVPGATPFELGSGTLGFQYTDGSGVVAATAVTNAVAESATATSFVSIATAGVPVLNAAIVFTASADVTAGDGALYIRIYYKTIDVTNLVTA